MDPAVERLLSSVEAMINFLSAREPERMERRGMIEIREAARLLRDSVGCPGMESQQTPWARADGPTSSADTRRHWSDDRLNSFKQAVLWAHLRLGPCCEREVNDFLFEHEISIGNRDNTKKRRGELERLWGYIVLDESAGRGPSLDGEPEAASRYRITERGRLAAAEILLSDLQEALPIQRHENVPITV